MTIEFSRERVGHPPSPTQWGAPSFAFLAEGGYHDRIRNAFCAERTKVASATSLPAPSTSSGQALAKNARMRHPQWEWYTQRC